MSEPMKGPSTMSNDSGHHGFTGEEATKTEAGRIRGIILDAIALRVGQVADVHPRLLEGIEVAARRLAQQQTPECEADPRDCCDRCGGAKQHRAPCAVAREASR